MALADLARTRSDLEVARRAEDNAWSEVRRAKRKFEEAERSWREEAVIARSASVREAAASMREQRERNAQLERSLQSEQRARVGALARVRALKAALSCLLGHDVADDGRSGAGEQLGDASKGETSGDCKQAGGGGGDGGGAEDDKEEGGQETGDRDEGEDDEDEVRLQYNAMELLQQEHVMDISSLEWVSRLIRQSLAATPCRELSPPGTADGSRIMAAARRLAAMADSMAAERKREETHAEALSRSLAQQQAQAQAPRRAAATPAQCGSDTVGSRLRARLQTAWQPTTHETAPASAVATAHPPEVASPSVVHSPVACPLVTSGRAIHPSAAMPAVASTVATSTSGLASMTGEEEEEEFEMI